jgi:hypothetical protein
MSDAGPWWQSQGISGGPQGNVPSESEGRGRWDLLMEGALDRGTTSRWREKREAGSGSLREGQATGWNEDCDRGRLWSPHRTRGRPRTLMRVLPGTTGHPSGDRRRRKWLQLVDAASTVSSLKVGDAGNGYSASSWKARCQSSRSRVDGGAEQTATGGTTQVASLRVGDHADSRDN